MDLSNPSKVFRGTSVLSSKLADVWNLRSVETSTGATVKFDYESDTYTKSIFQSGKAFLVKNMTNISCQNVPLDGTPKDPYDFSVFIGQSQTLPISCRYRIDIINDGIDMRSLFQPGQTTSCVLPYTYQGLDQYIGYWFTREDYVPNVQIVNAGADYIEVDMLLQSNSSLSGGTILYNYDKAYSLPGGGYRVKSVEVEDRLLSKSSVTSYEYGRNSITSGYTSYEPDVFDKVSLIKLSDPLEKVAREAMKKNSNLKYARELPAPGVMYQFVRVKENTINNGISETLGGYSEYEFQPLLKQMISSEDNFSYDNVAGNYIRPYSGITKNEINLKDYTSHVGKLKSVALFNANGSKISETKYKYLFDEAITPEFYDPNTGTTYLSSFNETAYSNKLLGYSYQGQVDEVTWDARFIKPALYSSDFRLLGVVSKRSTFPAIQTEIVNSNYKTNITTTTSNLSFDFYSGQVTKTLSTDGYNNIFATEVIPAYRKYDAMKPSALGGKNMLTQEAASYTYKVNDSYKIDQNNLANKIALVSASAQTWTDQSDVVGVSGNNQVGTQPGIWRKKSSFSFVGDQYTPLASNGDGLVAMPSFTPFTNWATHAEQPGWQKNAEITKYDYFSHALEAKDINGHYAATYMSVDQAQVVATVANANYWEAAALNAEDIPVANYFGGGVLLAGTYSISTTTAHTGGKSIAVQNGDAVILHHASSGQLKAGSVYQANIWLKNANGVLPTAKFGASIDGVLNEVQAVVAKKAGDWYQLQLLISVPQSYTDISLYISNVGASSTVHLDDFRFHPYQAAMTSYVYNNWGELTHILDNNNLYTEYRYDGMGRLKETYKESFQTAFGNSGIAKVSEINYNYGAKNPYRIQLSLSKSGPSGEISPVGNVAVPIGGIQDIAFTEDCPLRPVLQDIIIDGCSYGTNARTVPIPSGTILTISKTNFLGSIYTSASLKNIQGLHSVQAVFGSLDLIPPEERYECESTGGCFTGNVLYITTDACGNQSTTIMSQGSGGLFCTNPSGSGCVEN
jgi:hypothetical protein